jgi:hypothetical protein
MMQNSQLAGSIPLLSSLSFSSTVTVEYLLEESNLGMSELTKERESAIQNLETLKNQRAEIQALLEQDPTDEEIQGLHEDNESELKKAVAQLNKQDLALGFKYGSHCQVLWDGREWLTCRVKAVNDKDCFERVTFDVEILGYGEDLTVHAEKLRLWKPPEGSIAPGTKCWGIHSADRSWHECVVEIATPHNTVHVVFSEKLDPPKQELPLTHIKVGHHAAKLRKRVELSAEELEKRKEHLKQKKKEQQKRKSQHAKDLFQQGKEDWSSFMEEHILPDEMDQPKAKKSRYF